jgi:hypothetical protein
MRIKVVLSLVLTALVALCAAGSAQAAITVANQNDSGAGSLRQALAEAPPGETIVVPAGTYTLTSEPLKVLKSVTISGHGSADTTIRSGGPFGVFEITGPLDAAIGGVTIRDGNIAGGIASGAGIFCMEGNLALRDAVVTNNTANTNGAPGKGGGVAEGAGIWFEDGNLSLVDSRVTANTATAVGGENKDGGFVFGGGLWFTEGSLTVANTTISGNLADARGGQGLPILSQGGGLAEGGGAWVAEGDVSIGNSQVSGNTALGVGGSGAKGGLASGGGLWFADGSLTIASTSINGNLADARGGQGPSNASQQGGMVEGGGLLAVEGPSNIRDSQVSGNTALAAGGSGADGGVASGGGLWSAPEVATPSTLTGSTVAGNVLDGSAGTGGSKGDAAEGGGVWTDVEDGPVSISNTTIASNLVRRQATGAGVATGGGLWARVEAPGSLTLTSATIAANRLDVSGTGLAEGGNLFWTEATTIRNSIVAGGAGPAGSENCSKSAAIVSLGFNLESSDQCGFKAAGDQVNKDPLLGPLQLNGGLTPTMLPAGNSPAIDQGAASGLATDQRGVVRPIDLPSIPNSSAPGADGSDVGAVEFQPSNAFTLGKLKRNKKKGTATLAVILPQPSAGTLTLSGKGLKTQTLAIAGQSEVKLKVAAASKKIKKALRKKGKRKVGINVTYAPLGNSAATQSRKGKLVKKKRKHGKKHKKKHSKPAKQ